MLRISPHRTTAVLTLSTVTTGAKLLSIVTGVVAIQVQLTDRSLGGPWAALEALPLEQPSSWLGASFAAAGLAVLSERLSQRLRSLVAEQACVAWVRGLIHTGQHKSDSPVDVGKIARTAMTALLFGSALAEMALVTLALSLVHPLAAAVALISLGTYATLSNRRFNVDQGPEPVPDRNQLLALYAQLLASTPPSSSARDLLLERMSTEPRVLAPARAFLEDQRTRLRQATEAPLVLALMIGVLYLLAIVERDSDPVSGAAGLAISFLLIRILVGAILRLSRASTTISAMWNRDEAGPTTTSDTIEAIGQLKMPSAVFGVPMTILQELMDEAYLNLRVVTVTASESVVTGIRVREFADSTPEVIDVGDRLGIEITGVLEADIGQVPVDVRLALMVSSHEFEQTALLLAITAWFELHEETRDILRRCLPVIVLGHPTARSGVPDDVAEVMLLDEHAGVQFRGDLKGYRDQRVWEWRVENSDGTREASV